MEEERIERKGKERKEKGSPSSPIYLVATSDRGGPEGVPTLLAYSFYTSGQNTCCFSLHSEVGDNGKSCAKNEQTRQTRLCS